MHVILLLSDLRSRVISNPAQNIAKLLRHWRYFSALLLQFLRQRPDVIRFEAATASDVAHAQVEGFARELLDLEASADARLVR